MSELLSLVPQGKGHPVIIVGKPIEIEASVVDSTAAVESALRFFLAEEPNDDSPCPHAQKSPLLHPGYSMLVSHKDHL